MKLNNKITDIAIIDTTYSLFIYLIYNYAKINNTLFFSSNGISSDIRNHLNNLIYINDENLIKRPALIRMINRIRIYLKCRIMFFNRTLKFWGQDHLSYSSEVLGHNKMHLIEDGTANYIKSCFKRKDLNKIQRFIYPIIFGPQSIETRFGTSKYTSKIILTNIMPIPKEIQYKVIIINLQSCWKSLDSDSQNKILKIFNIEPEDIKRLKRKIILLTQICEDSKIEHQLRLYSTALSKYNKNDVVIKTHPREKVDYKSLFPDFAIFSKPIPLELLNILGCNFEIAITISSTAIYSLPKSTKKIFIK